MFGPINTANMNKSHRSMLLIKDGARVPFFPFFPCVSLIPFPSTME